MSPRWHSVQTGKPFLCVYTCVFLHQGSTDHGDEQSSLLMYPESPRVLNSISSLELPINAYSKCLNCIHLRVSFIPGGERPPAACDLSWNRIAQSSGREKRINHFFHQPAYIHWKSSHLNTTRTTALTTLSWSVSVSSLGKLGTEAFLLIPKGRNGAVTH